MPTRVRGMDDYNSGYGACGVEKRYRELLRAAFEKVAGGLVGEYRFDEGSGQTASDASGNGQDFTLGSAVSVDGDDPAWIAGGGINLSGAKYLSKTSYFYSGNQPLTMLFVTAVPAYTPGVYRFLFSSGQNSSNTHGTGIGFGLGGNSVTGGKLYLDHYGNNTAPANAPSLIGTGTQALYIVTLDASTNTVTILENGSSLGTHAIALNLANRIGQFLGISAWGGTGEPWNSPLHYAAFYDRVLTADEITAMTRYVRNLVAPRGITIP